MIACGSIRRSHPGTDSNDRKPHESAEEAFHWTKLLGLANTVRWISSRLVFSSARTAKHLPTIGEATEIQGEHERTEPDPGFGGRRARRRFDDLFPQPTKQDIDVIPVDSRGVGRVAAQ
jgi:hypothetical protein